LNGRERLNAVLDGRPTDRLPWTTLVDEHTISILPDALKGMSAEDFYRYIRCDIFQLGGWGVPRPMYGCRLVMLGVETSTSTDESGNTRTVSRSRHGVLTSEVSRYYHPTEYAIKTIDDLRILAKRWEEAYYEAVDESAAYETNEAAAGDDGITCLSIPPSVVPHLLEEAIGMEQFYYLVADYPEEMDALIRLMQEKELSRFELCSHTLCDAAILIENTSTRYISPSIYERYNLPSQCAFVDACHRTGKTAILHMCGHIGGLLDLIKTTGADGIHGLTPAPTGDCSWEKALDVLGEELIIVGALTPDIFHQLPLDEIGPALDRLITHRVRRSRFILALGADGTAVPVERFLAVRDWVESRG